MEVGAKEGGDEIAPYSFLALTVEISFDILDLSSYPHDCLRDYDNLIEAIDSFKSSQSLRICGQIRKIASFSQCLQRAIQPHTSLLLAILSSALLQCKLGRPDDC
eukprot:747982-Hanusia_phi.AAC.2